MDDRPPFHVIVNDLLPWMSKAFDIGTEGALAVPSPGQCSLRLRFFFFLSSFDFDSYTESLSLPILNGE